MKIFHSFAGSEVRPGNVGVGSDRILPIFCLTMKEPKDLSKSNDHDEKVHHHHEEHEKKVQDKNCERFERKR